MSENVSHLQAERRRAERWYGPWDETREAIIAAKGARESSDVTAEARGFDLVFRGEPLIDDGPSPAFYVGAPRENESLLAWFARRAQEAIYGEPVDFTEDRLG